jgi:hypothetical protein
MSPKYGKTETLFVQQKSNLRNKIYVSGFVAGNNVSCVFHAAILMKRILFSIFIGRRSF